MASTQLKDYFLKTFSMERAQTLLKFLLDEQKTSRKRKDLKAHVGWLDYDGKKYTQVKLQDGGGNREFQVDNDITAEEFKRKCVDLFFPEGVNNRGNINDFSVSLGNLQKTVIKEFKRACPWWQFTCSHLHCKEFSYIYCLRNLPASLSVKSSSSVHPSAQMSDSTYVFLSSRPSGDIYIRVPGIPIAHVVVAAPTSLSLLSPKSQIFAVKVDGLINTLEGFMS